MSVQFLGCELAKWEEAGGDALVLTFFREERPLRGAAGLADWRLCGRLSRLIKLGRLRGDNGESLLMPCGRHAMTGTMPGGTRSRPVKNLANVALHRGVITMPASAAART